jgi:phosphoribosylformimino-5-aminoimidazole carboxamide ribotide isomerase
MLLIFPSIEIRRGSCVQLVHGEPGFERTYSVDPVDMAVVWRGENAKTLHVIDVDGVADGRIRNLEIIRRMVESVDIPIQVGGGVRSVQDIQALFDVGVYRVVVGTAAVENPAFMERLIQTYGTRKVAVVIESWDGRIRTGGGRRQSDLSPVDLALRMKSIGVSRILFSSVESQTRTKWLDLKGLRSIAERASLRITAQGGVRNYKDLIGLQELESIGVDSVIIGQPLYENRFPCQHLWRINEQNLTDLGPTRRM